MSLTTTTVRHMGSFEIVSTKTTPIANNAPPPSSSRKKYASSVMSYESDLDSVMEEDHAAYGSRRRSRTNQQHRQAFSRIDEIVQASIPEKRPVSSASYRAPVKPALKNGRTSSLRSIQSQDDSANELGTHHRKQGSRVSFSNPSSPATTASPPAPRRKQRRARYIKRDHNDSDDSDSGNSVYSDASEYLPMPNIMDVVTQPKGPTKASSASAAAAAITKHNQKPAANAHNAAAAAAARSSVGSKAVPAPKARLTEAAVLKHNNINRASTNQENMSRMGYGDDDNDDVVSMNSTSSWQPKLRQSRIRQSESFGGPTVQRVNGVATRTNRGIKGPPPLKNPTKDYSKFLLKRTPSNSSFEQQEKRTEGGSMFKMRTLRAPRQQEENLTPQASDEVNPVFSRGSSARRMSESSTQAPKPFKTRFADSDSETELEPQQQQTNSSPKSFARRLSNTLRPKGFLQNTDVPPVPPIVIDKKQEEQLAKSQSPTSPGFARRLSTSIRPRTFSQSSSALPIMASSETRVNENVAPPQTPETPTSTASKPKKKRFGFFSRSKNQKEEKAAPAPLVIPTQLPEVEAVPAPVAISIPPRKESVQSPRAQQFSSPKTPAIKEFLPMPPAISESQSPAPEQQHYLPTPKSTPETQSLTEPKPTSTVDAPAVTAQPEQKFSSLDPASAAAAAPTLEPVHPVVESKPIVSSPSMAHVHPFRQISEDDELPSTLDPAAPSAGNVNTSGADDKAFSMNLGVVSPHSPLIFTPSIESPKLDLSFDRAESTTPATGNASTAAIAPESIKAPAAGSEVLPDPEFAAPAQPALEDSPAVLVPQDGGGGPGSVDTAPVVVDTPSSLAHDLTASSSHSLEVPAEFKSVQYHADADDDDVIVVSHDDPHHHHGGKAVALPQTELGQAATTAGVAQPQSGKTGNASDIAVDTKLGDAAQNHAQSGLKKKKKFKGLRRVFGLE